MKKIIDVVGVPACLEQLAEESAELSKAALKLARIMRNENPTPVTLKDAENNLFEEIADVRVCVFILQGKYKHLINTSCLEYTKIQRWIDRLREARLDIDG